MHTAKLKVDVAVQEYIRLFPQEYEQFKRSNQITIGKQKNKWASQDGEHALKRHLYDIPEKLHNAIEQTLTIEEKDWLRAKGSYIGKWEGTQWFMKKYPVFSVTKEF